MKILHVYLLTALMSFGLSYAVMAQVTPQQDIYIRGTILEDICLISTDSKDQTVSFDVVGADNLNKGAVVERDFHINFIDCDTDTLKTINLYFTSANVDAVNPKLLRNSAGAGFAKDVAIKVVYQKNGVFEDVVLNPSYSISSSIKVESLSFPFRATLLSPQKQATPGKIDTYLNFIVSYL